jgi:hypothetical protein
MMKSFTLRNSNAGTSKTKCIESISIAKNETSDLNYKAKSREIMTEALKKAKRQKLRCSNS